MKPASDRRPWLAALILAALLLSALSASASPRQSAIGPFHIQTMRGSLVRIGPSYYELRLRATVCFQTRHDAGSYPTAIAVTHFSVSRSRKNWWAARSVVDHAPRLVPFGETWNGRRCGPVWVNDPIPPGHYGVESLGNTFNCYGVRLTIQVGRTRASKRQVIQCPFRTQ